MRFGRRLFEARDGHGNLPGWRHRLAWFLRRLAARIDGTQRTLTIDWRSSPVIPKADKTRAIQAGLDTMLKMLNTEHQARLDDLAFKDLYPEMISKEETNFPRD